MQDKFKSSSCPGQNPFLCWKAMGAFKSDKFKCWISSSICFGPTGSLHWISNFFHKQVGRLHHGSRRRRQLLHIFPTFKSRLISIQRLPACEIQPCSEAHLWRIQPHRLKTYWNESPQMWSLLSKELVFSRHALCKKVSFSWTGRRYQK